MRTVIIPAIDLIEGRCVRLTKGDYSSAKVYDNNPVDVAMRFEDLGVTYLHVVDLDGAREKHIVNYKILEQLASKTSLQIDFGGGVQSSEDLKIAFESGAHQVTGGSIAVKNPGLFEQWIQEYSSKRIILGADSHHEKIAVSGWQEASELSVEPFIRDYIEKGIQTVIATDIAKDGMLQGPSISLYKSLLQAIEQPWNLIASGGVRSMQDIEALNQIGCYGVIVGKAIYEETLKLEEIKNYNA